MFQEKFSILINFNDWLQNSFISFSLSKMLFLKDFISSIVYVLIKSVINSNTVLEKEVIKNAFVQCFCRNMKTCSFLASFIMFSCHTLLMFLVQILIELKYVLNCCGKINRIIHRNALKYFKNSQLLEGNGQI